MRGIRSKLVVPLDVQQDAVGRAGARGLGDVAHRVQAHVPREHARRADRRRRRWKSSCRPADESRGLGNGFTVVEPFAMWGQVLPRNSFLQMHGGVELPSDTSTGRARERSCGAAIGTTFCADDRGFGRAWSPQVEVLWARPEARPSEWDVVPQIQVTLSKLQHVMVAGGVRMPVDAARRAAHTGARLSALGLVRRRLLRVLG